MNQEAHVPSQSSEPAGTKPAGDFIRDIVADDLKSGKHASVVTRFPPEPNGYLHIGHAKSICLNFGIAQEFGGRCHLRFDDTNPTKEEEEYFQSIMEDVRWLGFDWGQHLYNASDYFGKLCEYAEQLIQLGKAYVDDLNADQIREHRGTLTEAGRESPFRNRPVAENLDLFRRMRAGEFPDGSRVLRAKIDMASPNMSLRDPTLYRIRKVPHNRTGDTWCIYPMYDFAHPLSDAAEGITHSICTLEFENNRPLYDWFIETLTPPSRPRQIEFARLNLSYTLMSKRKLLQLVKEGIVRGWDDPRMPTLAGLRRRGITPEAIRSFCEQIGVAKRDSLVDMTLLENAIRNDLNQKVKRALAVLRPVKLVLDNWPAEKLEELDAPNFPDDPPRMGSRRIPFGRELFIERDDFQESPPKGFFRLSPGKEVRLRWAFIIKCTGLVKDPASGQVLEVHAEYDPASKSGTGEQRKVKGTIHWVSAAHSLPAEVRLYDRLFSVEEPGGEDAGEFLASLNPKSLEVIPEARLEPSLLDAQPGSRCQFERTGFFFVDPIDSAPGKPVFNRIVSLKDTWAKMQKNQQR